MQCGGRECCAVCGAGNSIEHVPALIATLAAEFALEDDALEELIEELVEIQQVAAREGKALAWVGAATRTWRR